MLPLSVLYANEDDIQLMHSHVNQAPAVNSHELLIVHPTLQATHTASLSVAPQALTPLTPPSGADIKKHGEKPQTRQIPAVRQ